MNESEYLENRFSIGNQKKVKKEFVVNLKTTMRATTSTFLDLTGAL